MARGGHVRPAGCEMDEIGLKYKLISSQWLGLSQVQTWGLGEGKCRLLCQRHLPPIDPQLESDGIFSDSLWIL